ncbi:hypothetical protein SLA2020_241770 [Shorea laevis]
MQFCNLECRLLALEIQLLRDRNKTTMQCMVLHKAVFILKNVLQGVLLDAQLQHTRSRACSCQKCCAKCLCVPPGTYGNKQSCPCYNNWKTKKGGPKCP